MRVCIEVNSTKAIKTGVRRKLTVWSVPIAVFFSVFGFVLDFYKASMYFYIIIWQYFYVRVFNGYPDISPGLSPPNE